jgi:hypothetical protein
MLPIAGLPTKSSPGNPGEGEKSSLAAAERKGMNLTFYFYIHLENESQTEARQRVSTYGAHVNLPATGEFGKRFI